MDHHNTHAPNVVKRLMDDVAPSIDVSKILNDRLDYTAVSMRTFAKLVRHSMRYWGLPRPAQKDINCFRTDVETTGVAIPEKNLDLSAILAAETRPAFVSDLVTRHILKYLSTVDTVTTNRLHVCIAGLLLGKTVKFYDNNYGKNREIYEYSLSHRFDNLIWME